MTYSGPRLDVCGGPIFTLKSDGQVISFLTHSFDSVSKQITIKLPDHTTAVKGVYHVDAVFSQPGEYTWSLGLVLTVIDICDASIFPNPPVLSPTSINYLIGQGDLSADVTWDMDSVSKQTGVECGGYSI